MRSKLPIAQDAVIDETEIGRKPAVAEMVPAGQLMQAELVPEAELAAPAVTKEYCPAGHRVHVAVVAALVGDAEPAGQA